MAKDVQNYKSTSTDIFKQKLDEYLRSISDEHLIPGYTAFRRISGNSLIHCSVYRSIMRGFQNRWTSQVGLSQGLDRTLHQVSPSITQMTVEPINNFITDDATIISIFLDTNRI